MYVQRLAEESLHDRLEQIFMDLLGPPYSTSNLGKDRNGGGQLSPTSGKGESWNPEVAGMQKRKLLKETLEVTGKFRELQSLNVHYDAALRELESLMMVG